MRQFVSSSVLVVALIQLIGGVNGEYKKLRTCGPLIEMNEGRTIQLILSINHMELPLACHCSNHEIEANRMSLIAAARNEYVTCGSVLKLVNTDYKVRLHSHDVKYGTGSGQQSVTATEVQEDANSHWSIMGTTSKMCERG